MSNKVVISACILGQYCRYDGKTKKIQSVVEAFKGCDIVPFCPEAPLFGTPRERISIVEIEGKQRVVQELTGKDVTEELTKEIETFCKNHPNVSSFVLKSKSPSCGNQTTPILDKNGDIISFGDGLATKIFRQKYPNLSIKDENDFEA